MSLADSFAVLILGLLVGGISIYAGARVVLGSRDLGYAITTAALGAVVLWLTNLLLGALDLLGSGIGLAILLATWIWFIRQRYSASWFKAALTAVAAWVALVIVLAAASQLGFTSPEALGFPTSIL